MGDPCCKIIVPFHLSGLIGRPGEGRQDVIAGYGHWESPVRDMRERMSVAYPFFVVVRRLRCGSLQINDFPLSFGHCESLYFPP